MRCIFCSDLCTYRGKLSAQTTHVLLCLAWHGEIRTIYKNVLDSLEKYK